MAITYQFNKTSLQGLEKDLKMRQRTLPTLQSTGKPLFFRLYFFQTAVLPDNIFREFSLCE